MDLAVVHLESFRAYRDKVKLCVDDITAITGRNDIGKSTILDALNIVLGDAKFDGEDTCKFPGASQTVRISCEFIVKPDEAIIIDQDALTTWEREHLLNEDNRLHIVWQFDGTKKQPTPSVFLVAIHDGLDLLNKKNSELKAQLKANPGYDSKTDQRSNVALREAIRSQLPQDEFALREIELKAEDGKKTWDMIKKALPVFRLFKSDRNSTDQDGEVQDPLKLAIKEAVGECGAEIESVIAKVQTKANDWGVAMLSKLKELDETLVDGVIPSHEKPDLTKAFKMALRDESGVAVNKRGSGVRRLILLSFFRVAAERAIDGNGQAHIIYGIEEPETSQHPSSQRSIVRALIDLASAPGRQVILTTHVPGLAAELPRDSIRFIRGARGTCPEITEGEDALRAAADALGVIPDPSSAKVLWYVEGDSDVQFLRRVADLYRNTGHKVVDLTDDIAFIPTGGSSLKHWVEQRYLEKLKLPEMHVYDRDVKQAGVAKYPYEGQVNDLLERGVFAELTTHRELENYIHPDAVAEAYAEQSVELSGLAYDFDDDAAAVVAEFVYKVSGKDWGSLDDDKKKKKISLAKKKMTSEAVLTKLTFERVQERDTNGDLERWLRKATELAGQH